MTLRANFTAVIDAPLESVERALLDPRTLSRIVESTILVASCEVESRTDSGRDVRRVTRMRAALTPPFLLPALSSEHLEWREIVSWDRERHRGEFAIEPLILARFRGRFECRGEYVLRALESGSSTERAIDVEITIRARWIGPVLERIIAAQLRPQFTLEARIVEREARR